MQHEFQLDTTLSNKQLNYQSTSVVIPHVIRTRIHQSMFYKTNLSVGNMRGDTMLEYSPILFKFLVDSKNELKHCGGLEFSALLLKLIEIKPTWDQISVFLEEYCLKQLPTMKYVYILLMCYLRIQYYYIFENNEQYTILRNWFKIGYTKYEKVKSLRFDVEIWNKSEFVVYHVDEVIDRLMRSNDIWGIPLGQSRWLVNEFDNTTSEEEEEEEEGEEEDSQA